MILAIIPLVEEITEVIIEVIPEEKDLEMGIVTILKPAVIRTVEIEVVQEGAEVKGTRRLVIMIRDKTQTVGYNRYIF
jgi:hypothetical protein